MKVILLLSLALCTSCKDKTGTAYIKIVGQISPDTVSLLEDAPPQVSKVIVTSQGGDTRSAIDAARVIRERGYELVVRRYCFSSCAQWLMPAAKRVTLEGMPVVALHHTATVFQQLLLQSGNLAEAQKYADVALLEQQFYDEIQVDQAMLTFPYAQTLPICYWPSSNAEGDVTKFAAEWGLFVLTVERYEAFTGTRPNGRWPETQTDIMRFGSKHIPSGVSISVLPEVNILGESTKLDSLKLDEC